MIRTIAILLLQALLVLASVAPATAHGILKRAVPRAGTSLDVPPETVTLVFNEPVDRVYSGVSVVDAAGRPVAGRAAVSSDGLTMTVPLDATAGTFTVRWRVLSQLDGHTTKGLFRFAVRAAAPSAAAPVEPLPVEDQTPGAGGIDLRHVVVRWIGLAATLLAAGTALFIWLVVRPLDSGEPAAQDLGRNVEGALRPVAVGSALIMGLAAIGEFVLQASTLLDLPLSGLLGSGMLGGLLVETKTGWSTLSKVILAAIFLIPATPRGRVFRMSSVIWFAVVGVVFVLLSAPGVTAGSRHLGHLVALLLVATVYGLITAVGALILPMVPQLKLPEGAWAPPIAGIMAVGAITISSHAAGRGLGASVIDWIHLVAAAAWIGGLLPMGVVLARAPAGGRADLARRMVPRFSQVAGWSLAVLVVTGSYSAWLHIPALRAFIATLYGRALLIKILIVVPVIALGAINRFVWRPRIARGDNGGTRKKFLRTVSGEVLLGSGILLAVAVLTIVPPAAVSFPGAVPPAVRLAGLAGDLRMNLTVTPSTPGLNEFFIDVGGSRSVLGIDLTLTDLSTSRAPAVVRLASQGRGRFTAASAAMDRAGMWRLDVVLRRQDAGTVAVTFPLLTGSNGVRGTDPAALRLLAQARAAYAATRSWRTVEQIADGAGNVVVTAIEAAVPDRLRYRTSAGAEAILIGSRRYQRQSGGRWVQDRLTLPQAVTGPFIFYLEQVETAALGRTEQCGSEECQIVLWEAPGRAATFAGWIGRRTMQVHRLLMVASGHFMTAELRGVNIPLQITPP